MKLDYSIEYSTAFSAHQIMPHYHGIKHNLIYLYIFFSVDERGQNPYLAALTPVSTLQEEPV
jgi:hypothetical protein